MRWADNRLNQLPGKNPPTDSSPADSEMKQRHRAAAPGNSLTADEWNGKRWGRGRGGAGGDLWSPRLLIVIYCWTSGCERDWEQRGRPSTSSCESWAPSWGYSNNISFLTGLEVAINQKRGFNQLIGPSLLLPPPPPFHLMRLHRSNRPSQQLRWERERERNDGCHRWLEPITSHIVTLYNAQSNDYTNNNSHQSGKSNRDDRILWHHWQRRLLLRFVSCFNAIQSLFPIQLTLMSFGMIVSTKFIFQFSDYRPPSMPNRAKTPRVDAWFKQSTPFTAPFRFMFYCNWIFYSGFNWQWRRLE